MTHIGGVNMLNNIQDNNQFFENLHADTIYRIMNIYHDPYQKKNSKICIFTHINGVNIRNNIQGTLILSSGQLN